MVDTIKLRLDAFHGYWVVLEVVIVCILVCIGGSQTLCTMENSLFQTLNAGIQFDKKRFGDQMELFSGGTKRSVEEARLLSGTSKQLATSLDFFGHNASTEGKKKKRKKGPAHTLPSWGRSDEDPATNRNKQSRAVSGKEVKSPSTVRPTKGHTKKRSRPASPSSSSSDSSDSSSEEDEKGVDVFGGETAANRGWQTGAHRPGDQGADAAHNGASIAHAGKAQQRMELIRAFRRRMRIHVKGNAVPDPCEAFDTIRFSPGADHVRHILLENIENSKYKEPTPIQMQAIPAMMDGRDVLAVAPTGSGKTAAFLIPLIGHTLKAPKSTGVRGLVLTPTRELGVQILRDFERLSVGKKFRATVLSKANSGHGTFGEHGSQRYDVLIATPLRLVGLIKEGKLSLESVECLVMDEADKLFEEGFLDQVDEIIGACSSRTLQRGMFSATMPEGIEEMVQSVLEDPVRVQIGARGAATEMIDQKLLFVGREDGKLLAMRQLVQEGLSPPTIVFVQSKERATALYQELVYDGINVDVIHAARTKAQRDEVVKKFRLGEVWVLICTDLMSRGMDFKGVNCVINYDFPQSTVSYVHRIGRTGRAGRKGKAITFFTESDMEYLRSIANVMKISGCDVPEWMLSMKRVNKNRKKYMQKFAPKRGSVSTVSGYDKKQRHKKQQRGNRK